MSPWLLKNAQGWSSVICKPLGSLGSILVGHQRLHPGMTPEQALIRFPIWGLGCSQAAGSPLSRVKSPDGQDGNKMEAQWLWVFSTRASNGPIPFFLCFSAEPQTFLLSRICFRGLCASNALNLFQVGALPSSPLALSVLSSPAPALFNLSTPESFAHSLLFFLIQVLILQSQIIPILRVFCSLTLFVIFTCAHL